MLLNNTVHAVNRWFLAPFLTKKIQLFTTFKAQTGDTVGLSMLQHSAKSPGAEITRLRGFDYL